MRTALYEAANVILTRPVKGSSLKSETWRVLRAYFPGSIETHSLVQDFFFGHDLMLRRHDYIVNIAGGSQRPN